MSKGKIKIDRVNRWVLPLSRNSGNRPDKVAWLWLMDQRGLKDMGWDETEDLMSYLEIQVERFD